MGRWAGRAHPGRVGFGVDCLGHGCRIALNIKHVCGHTGWRSDRLRTHLDVRQRAANKPPPESTAIARA